MTTLKLTKKYTRYPRYKDSGVAWIGKIPIEWTVDKVSHRSVANAGGVWGDDDPTETGTIVLRSTEINQDGSWDLSMVITRKLAISEFKKAKLQENDLLITKSSGSADHLGKTAIVTKEMEKFGFAYSNFMQRLRLNRTFLPKYFFYAINNKLGRDQINYWGSTTSGLVNLNATLIGRFIFPVPPESEQKKIVAYLDKKTALIDTIIEKKKKQIELLREKRTAVISSAMSNGSTWESEKIKHVVTSINSGAWGDNPLENSEDVPCLRVADFDYDNFSFSNIETIRNNPGLKSEKILRNGDILVEKSGGGEKTPVGRAILFNSDQKMVCANFIDVVRVNRRKILPEFLVLTLAVLYAGRINTKYIKQNTGIQNLDIKEYFGEIFSFPDIPAQKQIVLDVFEKIGLFEKTISQVIYSIERLQEFKSSLISHVVTGKVMI